MQRDRITIPGLKVTWQGNVYHPCAEDCCIQYHGRLDYKTDNSGKEPLFSRSIDRHEPMAQSEVELLDESRYEDCQECCTDPTQFFFVSEGVHITGSGCAQGDYAELN